MGDVHLSDRSGMPLAGSPSLPADSSLDEGNSGKDLNHARTRAWRSCLPTQEDWAEIARLVPGLCHVGIKEPPTVCNQGNAPGKAGLQGDKAAEEDLGEVGGGHPGCPCDSTLSPSSLLQRCPPPSRPP